MQWEFEISYILNEPSFKDSLFEYVVHDIKKVAFYRAGFGEVVYYDLTFLNENATDPYDIVLHDVAYNKASKSEKSF